MDCARLARQINVDTLTRNLQLNIEALPDRYYSANFASKNDGYKTISGANVSMIQQYGSNNA